MTLDRLEKLTIQDVKNFHSNKIKGDFTYIIVGDRAKIDLDYMKQFGPVKEVSLEQLFGY